MGTKFKYNYTEIGYCQVHFTVGETYQFCIMEEGPDVELFSVSDYDEPIGAVYFKEGATPEFEEPDTEYGRELLKRYKNKYNY